MKKIWDIMSRGNKEMNKRKEYLDKINKKEYERNYKKGHDFYNDRPWKVHVQSIKGKNKVRIMIEFKNHKIVDVSAIKGRIIGGKDYE